MSRRATNPWDSFARLYDWEHDGYLVDVDLHLGLARRFGGPVLELACGTGRLLAPLASAGFAVTGVDSSAAMLERARARLLRDGLNAALVQQRLEDLALDGTFRTIMVGLDSFGLLLSRASQLACLRAARDVATHDARLVLDLANGNLRGGALEREELVHDLTEADPETGRPITKFVLRRPRPDLQRDELTFFYDEQNEEGYLRRSSVSLALRWFTRFELELLLERGGWQVEEVYGSYDLDAYGPESERLITISRQAT